VSLKVHAALGAVFFLMGMAASFYGTNAVGIMIMDEARGQASRPILSAILTSLATGHRLLCVLLLIGLAYVVGLLVMALVLFLCKIPGIGPLLFTFVFPLCVVISGIAVFALYAVVMPLVAPATWSGASIMKSFSQLTAIARTRTIGVVLSMMVLMLIVGLVASIVLGVMGIGTMIAGGMSAGIVGLGHMGMGGLMSVIQGGGMDYGGGHLAAAAIGGGIVWAVALVLPGLVYLRGCCQVYLANIQGVDVDGMEKRMHELRESALRKADEIRKQGASNFEPVVPTATPTETKASPPNVCPSCATPYNAGDVFCGSCGHKLS
jgi:hypothetical protein